MNSSDFRFFINIKLYQIKGQLGQRSPEDHIIVASLPIVSYLMVEGKALEDIDVDVRLTKPLHAQ